MASSSNYNDLAKYIELWKLRSQYLDSAQNLDFRDKTLASRLKSISYFNGIFEAAVIKSALDHESSGLIKYQQYIARLRTA